ncbi:hypothetical protein RB195_004668 [Necator americanus]|uniref:Uncharacterized protein n=1 Tax=Necator americanus TaxID=51031 RepID=A0ABR1BNI7_NECAM
MYPPVFKRVCLQVKFSEGVTEEKKDSLRIVRDLRETQEDPAQTGQKPLTLKVLKSLDIVMAKPCAVMYDTVEAHKVKPLQKKMSKQVTPQKVSYGMQK